MIVVSIGILSSMTASTLQVHDPHPFIPFKRTHLCFYRYMFTIPGDAQARNGASYLIRKSSENLFSVATKQAAPHTCFFFLYSVFFIHVLCSSYL